MECSFILREKTYVINLRIAAFNLKFDATESELELNTPPSHTKFTQMNFHGLGYFDLPNSALILKIKNRPLFDPEARFSPIYCAKNWELWQDDDQNYMFTAPRIPSPQWIIVNKAFSVGEVYSQYSNEKGKFVYPLFHDLEIVFFVNWLGSLGDIILHASGVILDGKGYAFIGSAGAGKSTLAATLAKEGAVTNLGEDQVILRMRDGQFWIYGTPWHLNPEMCSPQGVRLEKLFFLERNGKYATEPIKPTDGITRILQTAFVPYYRPALVSCIMDHLVLLAEEVPFRSLSYPLGSDVLKLINGRSIYS